MVLAMSIARIEAELEHLKPDELRRLALKSWAAYVAQEGRAGNEVDEDDPKLLAALDEAERRADTGGAKLTGDEVKARIRTWTTR